MYNRDPNYINLADGSRNIQGDVLIGESALNDVVRYSFFETVALK